MRYEYKNQPEINLELFVGFGACARVNVALCPYKPNIRPEPNMNAVMIL